MKRQLFFGSWVIQKNHDLISTNIPQSFQNHWQDSKLSLVEISSFLYSFYCRWLFGTFSIIILFAFCFFLSSLIVFVRGSQGSVPPVQAGELYRDTVCAERGRSRHNWTTEDPAEGHTVDPKGCRQETGGWLPVWCWSSLSWVYNMGNESIYWCN